MYARLVRFSFGPGKRSQAQALADDLGPRIRALAGCGGVTFFSTESDGEGGLFVLWESQEAADDAAAVIGPQLSGHLAGNVVDGPDIRLFELLSE